MHSIAHTARDVEGYVVNPEDWNERLALELAAEEGGHVAVGVAQVAGQIIAVDENVRDGGFFEKGDVLVEIDARDYAADVRIAQAALADAQSALAEADARAVALVSREMRAVREYRA